MVLWRIWKTVLYLCHFHQAHCCAVFSFTSQNLTARVCVSLVYFMDVGKGKIQPGTEEKRGLHLEGGGGQGVGITQLNPLHSHV